MYMYVTMSSRTISNILLFPRFVKIRRGNAREMIFGNLNVTSFEGFEGFEA